MKSMNGISLEQVLAKVSSSKSDGDTNILIDFDNASALLDWTQVWSLEIGLIIAGRHPGTSRRGVISGDVEIAVESTNDGSVIVTSTNAATDIVCQHAFNSKEALQLAAAMREVYFEGYDYEEVA